MWRSPGYKGPASAYVQNPRSKTSVLMTSAGHPTIDKNFDETASIQGHEMRFVTLDLSQNPRSIRSALRDIALKVAGAT